jgi:hypothetical protein
MPYVVVPVLVAAGVFAGARWLAGQIARQAEEAARMAEDLHRRAGDAARVPKNLGALEYDAAAQVYRPSRRPAR